MRFSPSAPTERRTKAAIPMWRVGAAYPASIGGATKSSNGLQQVQGPCPLSRGRTRCLRRLGKWSEARRVKGLRTLNIIDEPCHAPLRPAPTQLTSYPNNTTIFMRFPLPLKGRAEPRFVLSVVLAWEQLQRFHKNESQIPYHPVGRKTHPKVSSYAA